MGSVRHQSSNGQCDGFVAGVCSAAGRRAAPAGRKHHVQGGHLLPSDASPEGTDSGPGQATL